LIHFYKRSNLLNNTVLNKYLHLHNCNEFCCLMAETRFEVPDWKSNLVKSYFDGRKMKNDLDKVNDVVEEPTKEDVNLSKLNISIDYSSKDAEDNDEAHGIISENDERHSSSVSTNDCQDSLNTTLTSDTEIVNDSSEDILHPVICSPSQTLSESDLAVSSVASTSPSSTSSSLSSTRPKLVKNKCKFPIKTDEVPDEHDQGRSCVFVVVKSRKSDVKIVRQRTVLKKSKKVENLVAKYELKFEAKYSNDVRAVYNFCFVSPSNARKFFVQLNEVIKSDGDGPNSASILMFDEEMLGFQHEPVLTEQDLLLIHSPMKCMNVFRTIIKVTLSEDVDGNVLAIFKSVVDLNTFIFDKCSNNKVKAFGELKSMKNHLALRCDEDGMFKLESTALPQYLRPFSEKYNFQIKNALNLRTLLFRSKMDMFKFLLSDDLDDIDDLKIASSQIINTNQMKKISPRRLDDTNTNEDDHIQNLDTLEVDNVQSVDCEDESELEVFESKDSGLNDSCATDVSLLEIALVQKEEEIKYLRSELRQRDEVIERQRIQSSKVEDKYFEASNSLEKITILVNELNHKGHIQSTIEEIRQTKE